jgi:hypothetical protein
MSPLHDKKYLAEITGMSVDYWDDQCSKELIPFTRFGRIIRFTDDQIEEIIEMHARKPKTVPTRDEVARRRSQRMARSA